MSVSQNYPTIVPSLSLDFTNVKALDPRVTFARASGAVYYDGQTVAKAEENLLLHSEAFNSWSQSGVIVTADATTAPNGTTTADLIDDGTDTTFHFVFRQDWLRGQPKYAFSFYAKDVDRQYVLAIIYANASNRASVLFDLTAETVADTSVLGAGYAVDSSSIVDVGDGWYRCSGVFSVGSPATFGICPSDSATAGFVPSYTGSNKQLFLWGAQLEARDAVTAYTPTTTQPITRFQPVLESEPANVARFDHNPVTGESLGLLVEEQRTNLVLRSEELTNAYWTVPGSSITRTANQAIAPDGTLTADLLRANVNNGVVLRDEALSASTAYSWSIYLKKSTFGSNNVRLTVANLSNSVSVSDSTFNLAAGTVASTASGTALITDVGNGWYRCNVFGTSSTAANYRITIVIPLNGQTCFAWGAQLEEGGFSTSYIKTVASQVTRAADSASMVGANFDEWYSAGEGTMFAQVSNMAQKANTVAFSISDGTINNRISLSRGGATSETKFGYAIVSGNTTQANLAASSVIANSAKMVVSFQSNDVLFCVNGVNQTPDTSAVIPVLNSACFGGGIGLVTMTGQVRKISYYPKALTANEIEALTS